MDLRAVVLALLSVFAVAAAATAQTEAVRKGAGHRITEDLKFHTGRTFTIEVGGAISIAGAFDAAPSGGTIDLGSVTLTLPANSVGTAQITDGSIANADLDPSAAIALSKLATDPLARANHTGTQLLATISDAGTLAALNAVASAQITDATIVNADIHASAAIALSKLATDPLARANHTGTQLLATISDAGTLAALSAIASAQITDGTIVNADISTSAQILGSKISIIGLTEDTTPDASADYVMVFDDSAIANKRVKIANLPFTGGDVTAAGDNDFTGTNTMSGVEVPLAITSAETNDVTTFAAFGLAQNINFSISNSTTNDSSQMLLGETGAFMSHSPDGGDERGVQIDASGITLGKVAGGDPAIVVSVLGGTTAPEFRLYEPSGSGSNYVSLQTGALSANRTLAPPDASGTLVLRDDTATLTNKTLSAPAITGAITLPDNVRQTFNPGADAAGLNVGAQNSAPGTPVDGDLFYDADDELLYARIDSAWVSLGGGIADGDKGDLTVTASGATWTLDNGTVTAAKTSITGTPTGAKFLRDDWSWQDAGGVGTEYIKLLSGPGGSGTPLSDEDLATPDFKGQFALSYNGNFDSYLWVASATSPGAWNKAINFPGGMSQIGDPLRMSSTTSGLYIHMNGAPTLWGVDGDQELVLVNHSADDHNSGGGINLGVMQAGFGAYEAEVDDGGTGYDVGDLLTVSGGATFESATPAVLRVVSESGGVITGAIVLEAGEYTTLPSNPVAVTGGSGSGATFDLTTEAKAVRAASHNSLAWKHVPSNRIDSLIPGWSQFVANHHATHNKGMAFCSPTIGPDGGNYSLWMIDWVNDRVGVPKWVSGKYQPTDSGWEWAWTTNASTGATQFDYPVTMAGTLTLQSSFTMGGVIQTNNGSGVRAHFIDGGEGGMFQISYGNESGDIAYLGKAAGLILPRSGQQIRLGAAGVIFSEDNDGALTLTGNGSGNDEALTFNFDDTADTVAVSSPSGVTNIDFGSIAVKGAIEAYDASAYNGSAKFVTQDALRDKIESMGSGGAGTKTIRQLTPLDAVLPASGGAVLAVRNSIPLLAYDAGTDEAAIFTGIIPEAAVLTNGLKVRIHWIAASATSGTVDWGAQWEAAGTDLDSDSFDTTTEASGTANGTSGIETITEITCTAIDSLTAGGRYRLKIYRDADDGTNDTATGDAQIVAIELRTAN